MKDNTPKNTSKNTGRPPITLKDLPKDPYRLTRYLASIFCTQEEIASALGISTDTLKRRCGLREDKDGREEYVDDRLAKAYKDGKGDAKVRLRRLGYEHAKRSYIACIFLMKNELGYTDRQTVEQTGDGGGGVTILNELQQAKSAKPKKVPDKQLEPAGKVEAKK